MNSKNVQAQDTCIIELVMPFGRIILPTTDTSATTACKSADEMRRGEKTFPEHAAEAIDDVLALLPREKRTDAEAWMATIPPEFMEQVDAAVFACAPRGHRCAVDRHHLRVTVEFRERPAGILAMLAEGGESPWEVSTVAPSDDERHVLVIGPGP